MLFTGLSELSIDPKQRLAIPAKYRNQWDEARDGKAWFCVPWTTGGILRLYTEKEFERLASQIPSSLVPGMQAADFEAIYFGYAERVEPDSAGRITVPKSHLDLTGLKSEVMVVGARNRLEVHDKGRWAAQAQTKFAALPAMLESLAAQGGAVGGMTGAPAAGLGGQR